jgi:hypothetical protein
MLKRTSRFALVSTIVVLFVLWTVPVAFAVSEQFQGRIYALENLKSVDSQPKLKLGDKAPDFSLPSLSGETVSLSQFIGKKNVVISFVPAAWTPVCSEQ